MIAASGAPALRSSDSRAHFASKGQLMLEGKITGVASIGPGNYVIDDDVYITRDAVLKIQPGTTLLFKNRTRLEVAGTLRAVGDPARGIIFKSLPVDMYFRNPYSTDLLWDGIVVTETGSAVLSQSEIRDARTGVSAPLGCEEMRISHLTFSNIPGTLFELPEFTGKIKPNEPLSVEYPLSHNSGKHTHSPGKIALSDLPAARKLSLAAFGIGTIGFTSLAVYEAISGNRHTNNAVDQASEAQSWLTEKSTGVPLIHYDAFEEEHRKASSNYRRMSIYSILAAAGAVGFVFTIPSPKQSAK